MTTPIMPCVTMSMRAPCTSIVSKKNAHQSSSRTLVLSRHPCDMRSCYWLQSERPRWLFRRLDLNSVWCASARALRSRRACGKAIEAAEWPISPSVIVLDEIHKYRFWKRWLKGEFDKLLLIDAVSSLGCIPVPVDAWGCDMVGTASQKGFMIPPGLAFISVRKRSPFLLPTGCPRPG